MSVPLAGNWEEVQWTEPEAKAIKNLNKLNQIIGLEKSELPFLSFFKCFIQFQWQAL